MKRGNVFRLPNPPQLIEGLSHYGENLKAINEHFLLMTNILNQSLQSMQNRLNTIQQTGARAPVPVSGFAVTGKQGLFHLVWNKIANVDGYVIVQASDSAMTQIVGRHTILDGEQCSFNIPVGNVSVTNSFQVYAFQGSQYGLPSPIATATSAVYGASEAAPASPPIAPTPPLLVPVRSGPNLA